MAIEIPDAYGNVLLIAVLVAAQCQIFGYTCIGPVRRRVFSKKFLMTNFGEEHQKHFKADPPMGGYPDMGNGRYADKLTYEAWFEFNNAQRSHQNYLEQLTVILILFLVGGIKHAVCTYYIGLLYLVARFIYTVSYFSGPNKRFPAVFIIFICLISQLCLAVHSSLVIANFNLVLSV